MTLMRGKVLLLGIWIAKNYVMSHRAWQWHHLLEVRKNVVSRDSSDSAADL